MSEKPAAYPLVIYPMGWGDKGFVVTDEGAGGSTYLVGNFGPHGPHLFAAAPDTTKALEGLIRFRNWEIAQGGVTPAELRDVWKDAEAALAKAKGDR